MNQIEFRAWDKQNKKMWSWADLLKDLQVLRSFMGNEKYLTTEPFYLWERMQYTGLIDGQRTEEFPEGKKIYQSDICKPIGIGMNHFGTGECKLLSTDNHHVWSPNGFSYNSTDGSDWLVIGNIYQNPELELK